MGFFSSLAPVIGGVAGFALSGGNPMGALAGASLGGALSGGGEAKDQNQAAINAQRDIAGASNQTIRDMYQTGRTDQRPFITPSLSALPMYQSAVLGGPVQYSDPRYQALTAFDPGYVQGQTRYRAPDGSIVDKAPMLTANYSTEGDPGFQWRNRQLDRSLRSLGRSNSTYGMQSKADFAGNEYDRGVNRLATLAGFGQGTASNVAAQGNQSAGQQASVNSNLSNSLSSLYKDRSNLYQEYSPLNMALNAGKLYVAGGGKF